MTRNRHFGSHAESDSLSSQSPTFQEEPDLEDEALKAELASLAALRAQREKEARGPYAVTHFWPHAQNLSKVLGLEPRGFRGFARFAG